MKALSLHSELHIMFYLYSFRVNIEQQNLARSTPTKCPLPSPGVHNDRIQTFIQYDSNVVDSCTVILGRPLVVHISHVASEKGILVRIRTCERPDLCAFF